MKTFAFIYTDRITFDEEIAVMGYKPVLSKCAITHKSFYKAEMINAFEEEIFTTDPETDAKLLDKYNGGLSRKQAKQIALEECQKRCDYLTKSLREKEAM